MTFFQILEKNGWYFFTTLLSGWPATLTVASGALVFALIFGLVIALMRISTWRLLRWPATAYLEFFRGTPALVQLFVIYFGFPDWGFQPSPLQAAIIGLGMNGAAYISEIYRAGIESIHRGQMEAALSLGMTPIKAMQHIILPQAIRTMLPPMTNFSIVLLKDTAIVFSIGVLEVMALARQLVTETLTSAPIYLMAGAMYLCVTIPMARLAARLERQRQAWQ
ncbi:MAG: amino acid ABC transporter permease [Alphaproteobacteria bacterium]|uniref:amino acid ABC transporter permease n=1 Tax=Aestuariivirga sp. TaxID=2650926 RepID=UPI00301915D6|nr:amino acid ABC transporter permease [Alphaproteobacteria bacterium]